MFGERERERNVAYPDVLKKRGFHKLGMEKVRVSKFLLKTQNNKSLLPDSS